MRVLAICLSSAVVVCQSSQVLPTERAANIFFAQATVNGSGPVWLTVDTGANLTVLDPDAARSAGLVVTDEESRADVGSAPGLTNLGRTRGAVLQIGQFDPFAPDSLFVVPVRSMSGFLGHVVDGVLGIDVMRRHVVEFDYAASAVRFHGAGFTYRGAGEVIPIDVQENILTIRASLILPDGAELPVRWLVDTGRTGRPMLNGPFVRRHRLIERFANPNEFGMTLGVNGFMRARTANLSSIRLGTLPVDRPQVDLSEATSGLSATERYDGHLGAQLLSRFRMVVDFPRRRLMLERIANDLSK